LDQPEKPPLPSPKTKSQLTLRGIDSMISSAILDNGSLAHPGGNITGVTLVSSDIAAKRLQFLRDIAPNFTRLAVIWNPDHVDPEYREIQNAAKTLGIQIRSLEVRSTEDFDSAFETAANDRISGTYANYLTTDAYQPSTHYRVFEAARFVTRIRFWTLGKGRRCPQLWTRY
jgi:ABC transporter substrate binding protein